MAGKPWHTGPFRASAAAVRQYAVTHPATRCWRCGLTIGEVRKHNPDAHWTAGHLVDGQVGGPLAPECSVCNYSAGGRLGRARQLKQRVKGRTKLEW